MKLAAPKKNSEYWLVAVLALGITLGLGVGLMQFKRAERNIAAAGPIIERPELAGLIDQQGAAFDPQVLRGRFALVYFGFTFCPDACPLAVFSMASALKKIDPGATQMRPIFVSIDPERDTPAVLKEYLSHFDPNIVGLTGEPSAVNRVEKQFGVIAIRHRDDKLPGGYTLDHSNEFLLLSREGRVIKRIPASVTPEQLVKQLEAAVKAESKAG